MRGVIPAQIGCSRRDRSQRDVAQLGSGRLKPHRGRENRKLSQPGRAAEDLRCSAGPIGDFRRSPDRGGKDQQEQNEGDTGENQQFLRAPVVFSRICRRVRRERFRRRTCLVK